MPPKAVRERHKLLMDRGPESALHEGMTASRVPHQLTDKYEALLRERTAALSRIEELDRELDYSLRLLTPDW